MISSKVDMLVPLIQETSKSNNKYLSCVFYALFTIKQMERVAFYIDGFNLYFGIKTQVRQKGWTGCLWLDICALSDKLLKSDQERVLCKYFTARINGTNSRTQRRQRKQNAYIEALETILGLEIFYGRYLSKTHRCNACGDTYIKNEEKMTDVSIATEMVKDAYEDNFDTAILISADSDLVPPTIAVQALGKKVIAIFPPQRRSQQLKDIADVSYTLGRGKIYNSQLPAALTNSNGVIITKPTSWT